VNSIHNKLSYGICPTKNILLYHSTVHRKSRNDERGKFLVKTIDKLNNNGTITLKLVIEATKNIVKLRDLTPL